MKKKKSILRTHKDQSRHETTKWNEVDTVNCKTKKKLEMMKVDLRSSKKIRITFWRRESYLSLGRKTKNYISSNSRNISSHYVSLGNVLKIVSHLRGFEWTADVWRKGNSWHRTWIFVLATYGRNLHRNDLYNRLFHYTSKLPECNYGFLCISWSLARRLKVLDD